MKPQPLKPYVTTARITGDAARTVADAVLARARALGIRVSVAVVEPGGQPLLCVRMDGALPHGFEIAQDKAYLAAVAGVPTAAVTALLQDQPEHVRQALTLRPRFITMGGGVPIHGDGMLLGAVGVSGGNEEQDDDCALAGIAALDLGGAPDTQS